MGASDSCKMTATPWHCSTYGLSQFSNPHEFSSLCATGNELQYIPTNNLTTRIVKTIDSAFVTCQCDGESMLERMAMRVHLGELTRKRTISPPSTRRSFLYSAPVLSTRMTIRHLFIGGMFPSIHPRTLRGYGKDRREPAKDSR